MYKVNVRVNSAVGCAMYMLPCKGTGREITADDISLAFHLNHDEANVTLRLRDGSVETIDRQYLDLQERHIEPECMAQVTAAYGQEFADHVENVFCDQSKEIDFCICSDCGLPHPEESGILMHGDEFCTPDCYRIWKEREK